MHRRRHAQLRFHWSVRASLRGVRRSSCVDVSSESGELFGWGTNSAGQLGTGSTDTVKTAAPAAGLGGVRVVEAVASTSHTIVRAGMCKSRRTSTSVAHCCLVIVAVTQHRVRCTPPGTTRLGSLALATTTPGPVLPSLLCTASRTLCRCRQVPSIPWRAQVRTLAARMCSCAHTPSHLVVHGRSWWPGVRLGQFSMGQPDRRSWPGQEVRAYGGGYHPCTCDARPR